MKQVLVEGRTQTAAPSFATKVWQRLGVISYNFFFTHFPSHVVRQAWLRMFGAKIGKNSAIFRGTTVFGIREITIGDNVIVSFRCLLDARGGLTIHDNVVIASDVHFITGSHLPDDDHFDFVLLPIEVHQNAWIASRATVLPGVTIGRGAVVGASSLVRKDVGELEMAAGVPAKVRGIRRSSLDYAPTYRPPFF